MTKHSPYTDNYCTTSDGLKLYYRDYNTATNSDITVLCMPGLTRNSKDFEDIANHMAKTCRVVCVEQRGRGNSDWDTNVENYTPVTYVKDMFTLIEHINPKKLVAVGTSLGGMLIMLLSLMKPGVFAGAVINDAGPELDPRGVERIKGYVGKGTPPSTWEEAVNSVKSPNMVVYPDFTEEDWQWFTRKLYSDENGKPVLQYDPAISKPFENPDNAVPPNLWPAFQSLENIPLVILRGGLSDILSSEVLDKMVSLHPDCTPVTVPRVGHVPLMTEPECIEAIDALLKKVS